MFLISIPLVIFLITLLTFFVLKKMTVLSLIPKIILIVILIITFLLFFTLSLDYDSIDLGNGFVYSEEQKHITGKVDLPPNVIGYDYDKHSIIVKQRPEDIQYAIYDKMDYVYKYGTDSIYY